MSGKQTDFEELRRQLNEQELIHHPDLNHIEIYPMLWRYRPRITPEQVSRELDNYLSSTSHQGGLSSRFQKLRLFLRNVS